MVGATMVAAVVALLVSAAPANAASSSHALTGTIGASTSAHPDPYPLAAPTDVEVDQATHDIYVTDPDNHRVEKFTEEGEFLLMFGKAVNQTTGGNVCPEHNGDVCQPGSSGNNAGALESPNFLAVDNSPGGEGDVYVGDTGDNVVSKFDSSGHLIASWGAGGQKDGSDATDLPVFGPIHGLATDPKGNLYVFGEHYSNDVWTYSQAGNYTGWIYLTSLILEPGGFEVPMIPIFSFDPSNGELYEIGEAEQINHYGSNCLPCESLDSFGSGDLSGGAVGIAVDGASHAVYVADITNGSVAVFGDVRPTVSTGAPSEVSESEITLTGHVDPAGHGNITSCRFEYGINKAYGTSVPCSPDPTGHPFEGPTEVTATISGLSAGTKQHYRLVATNATGVVGNSQDQTFTTTQPPSIDGLKTDEISATTADLQAEINPNGLETTYQIKYGPSTSYGKAEPEPAGTIEAGYSDHEVKIDLTNLAPGVVYHYTLVATNKDGTTTAEDHTFNFYPPSCPNENVRQQTKTNYLPDCRAYELVSPENAAGTQLYPGGPNTGYSASPSRFTFVGLYSSIPNSGGDPIDGAGDLYVATRTDSGWVTRYVGLPSNEVAVDGGAPMGPPVSAGVVGVGGGGTESPGTANESNGNSYEPDKIQNNVLTDPSMDTFVDWDDGTVGLVEVFGASNAPYVWNADGSFIARWPTNLATVPAGRYLNGEGQEVQTPGGIHAFDCPTIGSVTNVCPGDVTASSDLKHFVFASEWNPFAPGGQVSAPGSVYDNDTAAETVKVVSVLQNGEPIPAEATDESGDPLQIPAVSSDGSHILMAAGGTGPCGAAQCAVPPCAYSGPAPRCQMQPSHLYMRVDDSVTYDVSAGHDVTYEGSTPNGSKVYFASEEHLTGEDLDHEGPSLYMWSEQGVKENHPLTLISKGDNAGNPGEPGNTGACSVSFVAKCGIVTYSDQSFCTQRGGAGGNCRSDNSIASENGDIYFFSPEQLDGSRGIPNQENLYDYRNGAVQYVTTLTGGPVCSGGACSDTPVARMEVTPNDSRMAFVTNSVVTQYNNAGHTEMYTYEPSTRKLLCVSCIPSGLPPTSDILASEDGLFMTNDGRTFFSTSDSLVHGDTNEGEDVYEFVDGRPQLITPGTGDSAIEGGGSVESPSGLVGVSANGTDVYFSTRDTLVSGDHNGNFLKFYDARSGGGFSAPPPPPSCAAADECHGPGAEPPTALKNGTGAFSPGGNVVPPALKKHHKKQHRRSHRRHRSHVARRNRGGGAK